MRAELFAFMFEQFHPKMFLAETAAPPQRLPFPRRVPRRASETVPRKVRWSASSWKIGSRLGELPDVFANLFIEHAAVGHDDDRIEHCQVRSLQLDELMPEPRYGIALARAGGMFDQIPVANAIRGGVSE
jgi:hypothetical protein